VGCWGAGFVVSCCVELNWDQNQNVHVDNCKKN
jgi:hypothetical protein